jgi:hypothetical protein
MAGIGLPKTEEHPDIPSEEEGEEDEEEEEEEKEKKKEPLALNAAQIASKTIEMKEYINTRYRHLNSDQDIIECINFVLTMPGFITDPVGYMETWKSLRGDAQPAYEIIMHVLFGSSPSS